MFRSAARFATVALVAPLTVAAIAPGARATDDPTCVGTTTTGFVCDPYVTYSGFPFETTPHTETVCVVVCTDVVVPLPDRPPREPDVCVTWTDREGNPSEVCVVNGQLSPTLCPLIVSRAPGAGPIVIDDEGDVYLFGDTSDDRWVDCPPYEGP